MNLSSTVNAVNASDYRIDRKMVLYGGVHRVNHCCSIGIDYFRHDCMI